MNGLVLGNIDYLGHTSTEGEELQAGLVEAGWAIAGVGFTCDGCRDVAKLLDRYKPAAVFVQDVRDWSPASDISFRKDIGFENIEAIADAGVAAFTVLKDAWGWEELQSGLARSIDARGIACYYHPERVVHAAAPWTMMYPLIRIHHSVDADACRAALHPSRRSERKRGIVTGNAAANFYPLRAAAFAHADRLRIDTRQHPGYGNGGSDTPAYLNALCQYRVHVATAGKWGAAYRKIIESVACGCTPVTTLPAWDVLPEIDGALVRVPAGATVEQLRVAIDRAEYEWDFRARMEWAARAHAYYGWRASGRRLDAAIAEAAAAGRP